MLSFRALLASFVVFSSATVAAACGRVAPGDDEQPLDGGVPSPARDAAPPVAKPPRAAGPLSGTVVDSEGLPAAKVSVIVGGVRALSDAAGRFRIASAPAVYDLTLVSPSRNTVCAYDGMSVDEPTVALSNQYLAELPDLRYAEVTVEPVGNASDESALALEISGNGVTPLSVFGPNPVPGTAQSRHYGLRWRGPATATLRISGISYPAAGAGVSPRSYTGLVEMEQAIDDQAEIGVKVPFEPKAIRTRSVAARVRVPDGYAVTEGTLAIRVGPEASPFFHVSQSAGSGSTSFLVPEITGAAFAFGVTAYGKEGAWGSVLTPFAPAGATVPEIVLNAAPSAIAPADGSIGVSFATALTYTPYRAGATFLLVSPRNFRSEYPPHPTYYIASDRGATQLPDTTLAGLGLPRGVEYQWSVHGTSTARDVNEFARRGWNDGAANFAGSPIRHFFVAK